MDLFEQVIKTQVRFRNSLRAVYVIYYQDPLTIFNVLYLNPIDCSDESICHLAWLKNYEVEVKFSLKCSNGTLFKDLQPTGFNHCP